MHAESETNDPTILLAEDDPLLREWTGAWLRTHGFAVIEAASGDDALQILQGGGIDALVTDIWMPGALDGWALGEQARLIDPRIAIVYSSGRPVDIARQVSHSIFLRKPCHPDAIVSAIRQLTSARHEGGPGGD